MNHDFLLDTCAFIFLGNNPNRLSPAQKEVLENWENVLHISVASAYEIATKVRIGKLKLAKNTKDFWNDIISEYEIQVHPIGVSQALAVEHLPLDKDHRDPFDRLIAGFAREEGFTVITNEEEFKFYGCRVLT
jgi:PIN domain nuclease of toxin-antitoxin system